MDSTNLRLLMDEIHISSRGLAKKVGISFSTITRLLLNHIQYNQDYIDRLCEYFSVSSDFLCTKADNGYYAYYKDNIISLSNDDIEKFKDSIKITEIKLDKQENDELPKLCIRRLIEENEHTEKMLFRERIKSYVESMDEKQLIDTLEFIEKYILK